MDYFKKRALDVRYVQYLGQSCQTLAVKGLLSHSFFFFFCRSTRTDMRVIVNGLSVVFKNHSLTDHFISKAEEIRFTMLGAHRKCMIETEWRSVHKLL